ncbi:MAG: nickel ABC transporter permease [Intestinibacter sp.]|uniref:nickel ABC transporter permease n=2 Tax=Intestinibacter sp. TaxID=1965304 RepID=UPI002A7FF552|nr:nickel ABC transporter permease [Intestinibacter sp.]MDY4574473.1 nickel ABC transporter permease [Intestinibacter sp.]
MGKYIKKRLLNLIPILLGISFLSFLLMYLSPSDPAELMLKASGGIVTQAEIDSLRESLGLNEPFLKQYFNWLIGCLHGDFGNSYITNKPVTQTLLNAVLPTVELAVSSLLFTLIVSIPLGILSAVKRNKIADYIIRMLSFIGSAVPGFFLALILIYIFSIKLKILPAYGDKQASSIIMPTITLGLGMTCKYIRQIRAAILEELEKPYVIGARSRGIKENTIVYVNVLKNAMLTISTLIGLSFGSLLGGTCIVETIFMWPGLGKLSIEAITKRDYLLLQGYVVWIAVAFVVINLITDIVYRFIDPRIKSSQEDC